MKSVFIALIMVPVMCNAQYIGLGVSGALVGHTATLQGVPEQTVCCAEFNQGLGVGFGAHLSYRLPVLPWLQVRSALTYSAENVRFHETEEAVVDGGGVSAIGTFTHEIHIASPWVAVDLLLEPLTLWNDDIHLGVGVRRGWFTNVAYEQGTRILQPNNVRFENGRRTRNESSGTVAAAQSMFWSAIMRGGWQIHVDKNIGIVPWVEGEYGLTSLTPEPRWNRFAARFGVDVLFSLRSEHMPVTIQPLESPLYPPEPESGIVLAESVAPSVNILIPEPEPPSLEIIGSTADGKEFVPAELRFTTVHYRIMAPMLPYLFFDESNTTPSRRYVFTESGTEDFNVDHLGRSSSITDVHYQSLNIIGKRMQQHPDATLTIIGHSAGGGVEGSDSHLGLQRATWIKYYLMREWNIHENRLSVEGRGVPQLPSSIKTDEGLAENRRVEFVTSTHEILEPFIVEDTLLRAQVPMLYLRPRNVQPEAIQSWNIVARQNDRVVTRFGGEGGIDSKGIVWSILLDRHLEIDSGVPLSITLQVQLYNGTVLHASHELPASVERTVTNKVEQYNLVVFGYNSSELTESHNRIVKTIKRMIGNDSQVHIVGYADKTGNHDYNKKLSEKRAENVASALGIPLSQSRGVGSSELLFSNDTPEGRFFCRTVRIFVTSKE